MHLFVTSLGLLAMAVGTIGMLRPSLLVALIQSWSGPTRFWFAISFRLVIGTALILVAPACRIPLAVRILGGVTIAAALIILVAGRTRLDDIIAWWIADPLKIRCSSLFAFAIGVLFVYLAG